MQLGKSFGANHREGKNVISGSQHNYHNQFFNFSFLAVFLQVYILLNADGTLPTWTLIQRRGQYGNPEDIFSSKLWNDYEQGFREPEKGNMLHACFCWY